MAVPVGPRSSTAGSAAAERQDQRRVGAIPSWQACWKVMSRFERDHSTHEDPPGDAHGDAAAPRGSNSDAEDSAANIAELVRRTAERQAAPGPSFVAGPDVTVAHPPPMPAIPMPASPMPTPSMPPPPMPAPPVVPPAPKPIDTPQAPHPGPTMRAPSRRTMVAAGAIAALLILGGVGKSVV